MQKNKYETSKMGILWPFEYITECLKENSQDNIEIYSDIPGHNINGSTIPPNILVTSSRLDLVIIDKSNPAIYITLWANKALSVIFFILITFYLQKSETLVDPSIHF